VRFAAPALRLDGTNIEIDARGTPRAPKYSPLYREWTYYETREVSRIARSLAFC
jgi:hypothetical protein